MSTIASAIFFFNLGEYTAEVTLPIFLLCLYIDQKVVFGAFKGSQFNSKIIEKPFYDPKKKLASS